MKCKFSPVYQHNIEWASTTDRGGSRSLSCKEFPSRLCISEAKRSSKICMPPNLLSHWSYNAVHSVLARIMQFKNLPQERSQNLCTKSYSPFGSQGSSRQSIGNTIELILVQGECFSRKEEFGITYTLSYLSHSVPETAADCYKDSAWEDIVQISYTICQLCRKNLHPFADLCFPLCIFSFF